MLVLAVGVEEFGEMLATDGSLDEVAIQIPESVKLSNTSLAKSLIDKGFWGIFSQIVTPPNGCNYF